MQDDQSNPDKARSALNGNPRMCGARTREGHPCRQPAMENGRCRLHGGLSLFGLCHPNLIHGRRSKYLPHGLIAHFERRTGRRWPSVRALPHAGRENSAVSAAERPPDLEPGEGPTTKGEQAPPGESGG